VPGVLPPDTLVLLVAHTQYLTRFSLFCAYSPNFKQESEVQKKLFVLVNKREQEFRRSPYL
jgi:hypothetical protein